MKPKFHSRPQLCVLIFAFGATQSLHAQLYWDLNDATPGAGATPNGNWSTAPADANWTTDAEGDLDVGTAWVDGSDAVFSAGTDAITNFTSTVVGTVVVDDITFEEGATTFIGNGAAANLTFTTDGATSINFSNPVVVFNTRISGTNTVGITGNNAANPNDIVFANATNTMGNITLAGADLFNDATTGADAFGTGSNSITLNGNAGLIEGSPGGTSTVGNAIVISGSGNRFSGFDTHILSGQLSGAGSVSRVTAGYGGSDFVLSNADNSTFTGTFTNVAGNTFFDHAGAGSANADWILNAGQLNRGAFAGTATIALGSLSGTGGTLQSVANNTATTFQIGGKNNSPGAFAGQIVNGGSVANARIVGIEKVGSGTLHLTSTNTYTGATNVTAGKLLVSGSIGSSAVTVSGANTTLASGTTGTIGSSVTINIGAILAAGDTGTVGLATVTGATSFNTDSIFSWDLGSIPATTGRGTNYDALDTGSLAATSGAVFRVVLNGSQDFSDSFWNSSQQWTDIFKSGATNLDFQSVFSGGIQYYNANMILLDIPTTQGAFTISGSNLNWSAVPEPSSALMGLLFGAGLLGRRRRS